MTSEITRVDATPKAWIVRLIRDDVQQDVHVEAATLAVALDKATTGVFKGWKIRGYWEMESVA